MIQTVSKTEDPIPIPFLVISLNNSWPFNRRPSHRKSCVLVPKVADNLLDRWIFARECGESSDHATWTMTPKKICLRCTWTMHWASTCITKSLGLGQPASMLGCIVPRSSSPVAGLGFRLFPGQIKAIFLTHGSV